MKAIQVHQFGAPEVLQLEEVPDPISGAGQILIRVHAAGANPLDTYLRAGVKVGDYTTPLSASLALGFLLIGDPLNQAIHAALYQQLENGTLRPVVDQEIPLAEAPRAHYELEKSGSLGKICLIP